MRSGRMRTEFSKRVPQDKLRLLRSFQLDPTKSIKDLAIAVGVPVLEVDMPGHKTAYLTEEPSLEGGDGYVIYVNKARSKEEKRWAVAHELGHYFLHRGNRGPYDKEFHLQHDYNEYFNIEKEEYQADNFAEDLFFSDVWMQLLHRKGRANADEIARSTCVPSYRAERRLKFLSDRRKGTGGHSQNRPSDRRG